MLITRLPVTETEATEVKYNEPIDNCSPLGEPLAASVTLKFSVHLEATPPAIASKCHRHNPMV